VTNVEGLETPDEYCYVCFHGKLLS